MEWEKDLIAFLIGYLIIVAIATYKDMADKNEKTQSFEKYAWWLIYGGIFIGFISILLFLFKTTGINLNSSIDTNLFDHFGSFIGGLVGVMFSLSGVFLLIQTLRNQEKDIYKNKIEQRFFELVRIHKENAEAIEFDERNGKRAIGKIVDELLKILRIADDADILTLNPNAEINVIRFDFKEAEYERKYTQKEKINISCLALYFGFDFGKEDIIKEYAKDYEENYVDKFISLLREEHEGELDKYAVGYESNLGTYFRHLYQVVTYIDKLSENWFNYKDKYEYVKTLRAQFTNKEQVLFFLNSLCVFGENWELNHQEENKKLITKYNFIKNIPKNFVTDIDVKEYYPKIKYEGEIKSTERKELEKNYS